MFDRLLAVAVKIRNYKQVILHDYRENIAIILSVFVF